MRSTISFPFRKPSSRKLPSRSAARARSIRSRIWSLGSRQTRPRRSMGRPVSGQGRMSQALSSRGCPASISAMRPTKARLRRSPTFSPAASRSTSLSRPSSSSSIRAAPYGSSRRPMRPARRSCPMSPPCGRAGSKSRHLDGSPFFMRLRGPRRASLRPWRKRSSRLRRRRRCGQRSRRLDICRPARRRTH
jgi:hypothetical protein